MSLSLHLLHLSSPAPSNFNFACATHKKKHHNQMLLIQLQHSGKCFILQSVVSFANDAEPQQTSIQTALVTTGCHERFYIQISYKNKLEHSGFDGYIHKYLIKYCGATTIIWCIICLYTSCLLLDYSINCLAERSQQTAQRQPSYM